MGVPPSLYIAKFRSKPPPFPTPFFWYFVNEYKFNNTLINNKSLSQNASFCIVQSVNISCEDDLGVVVTWQTL